MIVSRVIAASSSARAVLRATDTLQLTAKQRISTLVNCEGWTELQHYLRVVRLQD